jgi:hypothetical protein
MFGRLLGNTFNNRQIPSTLVQSLFVLKSLPLASRSYRETLILARSRSRSLVGPNMEPSPLLLIMYTLLGVILRFHQVTSSLNLRLDAAFMLYYVVVVLFLGSACYLFANFTIDIIEIASTWRADDPALSKTSWLLWVGLGTAATALLGMLALLVYNLGGSWKSAKQNFATDRAKAEEEAKSINEKKVAIGVFTLYTWVFLYSRAFFDAALWAMELFEKGKAERQMVPPLWHSLGPFAIVGIVALARSDRVRGETASHRVVSGVADEEKLVVKDSEAMTHSVH